MKKGETGKREKGEGKDQRGGWGKGEEGKRAKGEAKGARRKAKEDGRYAPSRKGEMGNWGKNRKPIPPGCGCVVRILFNSFFLPSERQKRGLRSGKRLRRLTNGHIMNKIRAMGP